MSEVKDEIILRGLKENNLKNVDLNIPKEKLLYLLVFQVRKESSCF